MSLLSPYLLSRHLLLSLVLCSAACGAGVKPQAMAIEADLAGSANHPTTPAVPTASASGPQVAAALRSSDTAWAVDLLMSVHCIPDSDAVEQIRHAWRERDSFTANQAMHDQLVRTYAAKCVVVSSQTVATEDTVKDSAAAQLREALTGPSARAAQAAMLGMHVIATDEDVETIAALAVQKPEIAIAAASTLSKVCGPNAAAALQRIVTFYAGNALSLQLESVVSQQRSTRASLCGLGGAQPGTIVSPKPTMLPGAPDAAKTREALTSSSRADAVRTLLTLRCSAYTTGAVDEILRAVLAAYLAGKQIGIGLNGCSSSGYPVVYGVNVYP
jgi:hypothetical protein